MQRYSVPFMALLFAVTALAQKPDFTGTWKQAALTERTRIDKVTHQEPNLKIATESRDLPVPTTLQRPVAMLSSENEYRTDGTEQVSQSRNGQLWRTVNWQGAALVFQTVTKQGYHVTINREAWTLSADGKTLTKSTRLINMDGITEQALVFEKR